MPDARFQRLTDTSAEDEFKTQRLSNSLKGQEKEAPIDKGGIVKLTFLFYGIGVLLPFNVIMACLDFYGVTVSSHFIVAI